MTADGGGAAEGRPGPSTDRLWALVDAGVAVSGELELDAVLRRIVRVACQVIGCRYGAIGVLNETADGLANFVFHGVNQATARRIGHLPEGKGLLGAVIENPHPIRLRDLQTDERSVGFPEHHPPMRTFLGVPVVSKGRVFGNLYLTEKLNDKAFTLDDERLAVGLAAQAGVAVHNARLYAEAQTKEREAGRRLQALASVKEVGEAVLSELDPDRVLRMVASQARDLVKGHSATIAMLEPSGEFRLQVVVGRGARRATGSRLPVEGSLSGHTLVTGEPARVDDLQNDPRAAYPIARALDAHAAVFAPLFDRGVAIGVLGVTSTSRGRFDDDDLQVLTSFANMASLALRNARLVAEERTRAETESELAESRVREELRSELLGEVIRAQEDERKRIARDLHDSTGQLMASILLGLKVAAREETLAEMRARIADVREMAADAAGQLRRLSVELRPNVLDDLGLETAMRRYLEDVRRDTDLTVTADIDLGEQRLPSEVEIVVYRVLQEAVTNVRKHADATHLTVRSGVEDGSVTLRVRDNGGGFEVAAEPVAGIGLRGMEERAGLVGGKLRIRSAPGKGTTVELEIPVA